MTIDEALAVVDDRKRHYTGNALEAAVVLAAQVRRLQLQRDNLAMLMRRMLRQLTPGHRVFEQASVYLAEQGLCGSPLRDAAGEPQKGE